MQKYEIDITYKLQLGILVWKWFAVNGEHCATFYFHFKSPRLRFVCDQQPVYIVYGSDRTIYTYGG